MYKRQNSSNQDYAITGISYENGTGEKEIYYSKNETKLKIIKKDENGEKNLANAVFQLLDKDKNLSLIHIFKDIGLKEPYIGVIPISSGEIAEDFARYFTESEQTRSAVALGVLVDKNGVKKAGGSLLTCLLYTSRCV